MAKQSQARSLHPENIASPASAQTANHPTNREEGFLISKLFLSTHWTTASYLLFVAYAAVALLTFSDYGITWDESWHSTYGQYILDWYSSLFRDTHVLTYWVLIYYGGFFTTIAQAAAKISPLGLFETRHLIGAVFGLCGIVGTYKLGKYLAGPFAGFLSALFLVLTPSFYGHTFNNALDVPFASLFVISMYFIITSIAHFPRIPPGLLVKLGIAIGLALGVRVAAFILLGYFALAICLWVVSRYVLNSGAKATTPKFRFTLWAFSGRVIIVGAIAYVIMLVWWPWALVQPFTRPLRAFLLSSNYPWLQLVFFEGKSIIANELPWYYVSKWFLITLPEFYFIALFGGLILLGAGLFRFKFRGNAHIIEYAVLAISVIFPPILQAISHAVVYDGIRHFLFVMPMLAVAAAISVAKIVQQPRPGLVTVMLVGAILLSMFGTIVDMVQLHPNEYIFFNRVFGGGLQKAAQSFETDYYGNSYKEGVEWIAKNYMGDKDGKKIKVASCSFPLSTEYFLPKDQFEFLGSISYGARERPDLFLATTRWGCDQRFDGRIVHVVERQGTPLLYIKEIPPIVDGK